MSPLVLRDLAVSNRAKNALAGHQASLGRRLTVEELSAYSDARLLSIPRFGKTCLFQLRKALALVLPEQAKAPRAGACMIRANFAVVCPLCARHVPADSTHSCVVAL